ncbi:MAG: endonuclease VIII Nei2 [Mycobacterium sp.]
MPEGDTVFRTAAILREALQGKTLTRCDIRVPRYATVDLTGERVDDVLSRGKHLFIRVGPASIHSHLKMDGSWRISPRGVPDHKIRILLQAGPITAAGIDLGVLEILDRNDDVNVVAHLGPDLLGPDWDAHAAAKNMTQDPDRSLAQALLDQRNLAGIGNVYCNELCFLFGRLPTSAVSTLSDPLRVVIRAQQMLWANRLRQARTITGNIRPGHELWVYGRAGQPCRRCSTRILRTQPTSGQEERISYWCPACQC